MIKVKICGITNIEDALLCAGEGASALGFIFTKKSPRYVNEKDAKKIISQLDPFIIKVGVFLDEEKEKAFEVASALSLNVLQFHGQETPAYCSFFKPKFKVIKVLFPQNRPFAQTISRYDVDAFMFDITLSDKAQGKTNLDKDELKEIKTLVKTGTRVIVSGGLTVKNISPILKIHPFAVDIASGLEKFVGKKDESLVRQFMQNVREREDQKQ